MYVLSYFRTEAEALHLAVSDDGLDWSACNDDEPVLRSDVGARSLRDPFLVADGGGTYHMLATDGWESRSIAHAASEDLVSWTNPELVGVMTDVPGTRNAWAPECFYDRGADVYRLLWSSTVNPGGDEDLRDHRIWSCATPDFETFGAPACLFDPGYNVIDATVAHDGEGYLMAFKDERGANDVDTEHKAVRMARAPTGGGPFEVVTGDVTPAPVEGPTLFRVDGEWRMLYDHFVEGGYGASCSTDGLDWETCTDDLSLSDGVRHGSVIEVPDALGEDLRTAF